jgi:tripartite motif-containing protein 71
VFTTSGTYLTQWAGQFQYPYCVAVDASGDVYVTDTYNNRIQKFTSSGANITQWGAEGTGDGQFYSPTGLTVDASGNVYVVDAGNSRIQKFGSLPVPMHSTTWGRIKSLYR